MTCSEKRGAWNVSETKERNEHSYKKAITLQIWCKCLMDKERERERELRNKYRGDITQGGGTMRNFKV